MDNNLTNKDTKNKSNTKMKKALRIIGAIFWRFLVMLLITVIMIVLGLHTVMWAVTKGPSSVAKSLFVLSVKESSAMGFLASWYCTDEEIEEIEQQNGVKANDDITDTSLIDINNNKSDDENNTDEVKKNDEDGDGIEIIKIKGDTYTATMMIVYDSSRVVVGTTGDYGEEAQGMNLENMMNKYGVDTAINAGGFEDENGTGTGGIPIGVVISEGKLLYGDMNKTYEIIGFDENNIFVVGRMTAKEAINRKIRDAVSFGPLLIVNGVSSTVGGTGGGLNPRTAIGQRADGSVLLLCVDGRQAASLGATYKDLIEIMHEYGAVNAANLDGGSSTTMYYNGEIINNCSWIYEARSLPTAFLVKD